MPIKRRKISFFIISINIVFTKLCFFQRILAHIVYYIFLIHFFQIFDYAQYYLDLADANRKVAEANMKEGNGGLDSINR